MRRAGWTGVQRSRAHSAIIRSILGFAVCAGGVVTACTPPPGTPIWQDTFLTRSKSDSVSLTAATNGVTVSTPKTNSSEANTRSVLVGDGSVRSDDQRVCATASHAGGISQEGVALRVRSDGGRTRAITVTRNVYLGATGTYNVHVWDTSSRWELPATLVSSADLSAAVPADAAKPRRLCAQVKGDVVTLKVWSPTRPEPS